MLSLAELKLLVMKKSGAPPLDMDHDEVVRKLGYDIGEMRDRGYDAAVIAEHQIINRQLSALAAHPTTGQYLLHLLPTDDYTASGWRVFSPETIRSIPCLSSIQHGYFPMSGWGEYGDELFLHKDHGIVYGDTCMWDDYLVSYLDVNENLCSEPYTPDSLRRATQTLSSDIWSFLSDFLQDNLEHELASRRKRGT